MSRPPDRSVLAPLVLHRSQIEAIDATARDIQSANPAVPRVSTAWALSELLTRGCQELESLLAGSAFAPLRAPSPPRGAPPRKVPATGEYRRLSPVTMDRALVRRVKALAPRVARALKRRVALATVIREALLLGYAAREAERADAERCAQDLRAALAAIGYLRDAAAVRVTATSVVIPYTPPGRRSAEEEWKEPVRLNARAQAAEPRGLPEGPPAGAVGADVAPQADRKVARSGGRRSPRRAKRRRTTRGADDGDAGPPPTPARRAPPSRRFVAEVHA